MSDTQSTQSAQTGLNQVSWFEILGEDTSRLRSFFGELFGWQFKSMENMDYGVTTHDCSDGIPGGVGKDPAGKGGWTTFYVTVPDVRGAMEQAKTLGGSVIVPLTKLPDGMDIAVIADPEGHPVGLVSPAKAA